jgi:A/G-specific adenine glycosylase
VDEIASNGEFEKPAAAGDPLSDVAGVREALADWFDGVGKDYPWRRTVDPYAILVSEIMLQQTQIATVLGRGYFENWLAKFPDVRTLAAAGEDEILKAWEGLGYYRRARNLQKAARAVVDDFGGLFPKSHDAILALPGVGEYTAGAVTSFAYNQAAPMVDANVARVLARLFDFHTEVDSTAGKKQLTSWSGCLVDPENARTFNSAIMELGQRICAPRKPACTTCPVAKFCACQDPERLPKKKAGAQIEAVEEFALFVRERDQIWLCQEKGSRRAGLWKLPPIERISLNGRQLLLATKYSITRYRVSLNVYPGTPAEAPGSRGFNLAEIEELAIASPYRKALSKLLAETDSLEKSI